jgi:hypothetical protein
MKTYFEATGDHHPDGRDVLISAVGASVSAIFPGIPEKFRDEFDEGRLLYILGVWPFFELAAFKEIFESCGTVNKCPCVIDLKSCHIFRWVVMSTADEAKIVLEKINGKFVAGRTLQVCKPLPPGDSFLFKEEFPLEKLLTVDLRSAEVRERDHRSTTPGAEKQPSPAVFQLPTIGREDTGSKIPALADGDSVPLSTSWANIASIARGGSRSIDLKLQNRPGSNAPRLHPVGRIPAVTRTNLSEPMVEQMRVIFLFNLPNDTTIAEISDAIKEGPLVCRISTLES